MYINSYELQKKELWVTSVFIVACLLLSLVFPSRNETEDLLKGIFFLVIMPVLYIKFILKKNLTDFGFNLNNPKNGIKWAGSMFLVSCAIALFLIKFTDFGNNFTLSTSIINNFWYFFLAILIFANINIFIQEYFFRGFIISYFKDFSVWSVVLQGVTYFSAILISQKGFGVNFWQLTPYLIITLTGGIVAFKSGSMIYSYFSSLIFFIFFYSYIIYSIKLI